MEETKKLHKSRTNKVIDGVCGGIAEYFNVDPVIVRIIFVLLAVWAGVGVILYIIGMIIMPVKGEESIINSKSAKEVKQKVRSVASEVKENVKTSRRNNHGEQLLGLILLLIGFVLLFNTFFPSISFHTLWPLLLVIIGVSILLSGTRKD